MEGQNEQVHGEFPLRAERLEKLHGWEERAGSTDWPLPAATSPCLRTQAPPASAPRPDVSVPEADVTGKVGLQLSVE